MGLVNQRREGRFIVHDPINGPWTKGGIVGCGVDDNIG